MASKQVYIGKVVDITPIPGADNIEAVSAVCGSGGRWQGVVQKGSFQPGAPCQVYLQDSLLPHEPQFAFMEKYGYRVRMTRFRGVPSEALILPQTVDGQVGDDVTGAVGVVKYEKLVPACLMGEVCGGFPQFVPKTDEPNFQGVPEMVEAMKKRPYYVTVKVDGSSGTAYRHEGHFGVCSRNWELRETEGNAFWRCMTEPWRGIPEGYAVQFEAAGPGIQGNPVGLDRVQPFAFQVWNIKEQRYLNFGEFFAFADTHGIVPVTVAGSALDAGPHALFDSAEALRTLAEGTYPNGRQREGIVIRPMEEVWMPPVARLNDHCSAGLSSTRQRLSFKVINLLYKERR